MDRGRLNPWGAYVDLFSGLVLILLVFAAGQQERGTRLEAENRQLADENRRMAAELRKRSPPEEAAARFFEKLDARFREAPAGARLDPGAACRTPVLRCIDVSLQFPFEKDDWEAPEVVAQNRPLFDTLCRALGDLPASGPESRWRVLVEGHSDSRVDPRLKERARFKYNWDLSAQRASAVMYSLERRCGLPRARMEALGRADAQPVCDEAKDRSDDCRAKNRRIRVKIAYDFGGGVSP